MHTLRRASGFAFGLLLVPSLAAAQTAGASAPLGVTAELEIIHANPQEEKAGSTSFLPRVGYRVAPSVVVELGVGIDRVTRDQDIGDDPVSSVWIRPRVLASHQAGAVGLDVAFGVTIDPATDELLFNQETNFGATLDLRLRYAVSPTLYLFGGTMGGGGAAGATQATTGLAGIGSGASITRFEIGDAGETMSGLVMLADLSLGVGAQVSPTAHVEVELPIWSGVGLRLAEREDPNTGSDAVLLDEYYALQVSGWIDVGPVQLGGRLAGWWNGNNDQSDDNELELVRVSVSARGSF